MLLSREGKIMFSAEVIQSVVIAAVVVSMSLTVFSLISLAQRILQERVEKVILDIEELRKLIEVYFLKYGENFQENIEEQRRETENFKSMLYQLKNKIKRSVSLSELINVYINVNTLVKVHNRRYPELKSMIDGLLGFQNQNGNLRERLRFLQDEQEKLTSELNRLEEIKIQLQKVLDENQTSV
jgi:hypothetical protein